MKSLLTFLAFNVVLLICCYEKKCAGSLSEPSDIEPVDYENAFTAKFETHHGKGGKWDSRMHMEITNGLVKGYYCEQNMRLHINVVGAVTSENTVVLVESENGIITRTFQGKLQKKAGNLMHLSGIWEDAKSTVLPRSDIKKVLPHSDAFQALLSISKKQ